MDSILLLTSREQYTEFYQVIVANTLIEIAHSPRDVAEKLRRGGSRVSLEILAEQRTDIFEKLGQLVIDQGVGPITAVTRLNGYKYDSEQSKIVTRQPLPLVMSVTIANALYDALFETYIIPCGHLPRS